MSNVLDYSSQIREEINKMAASTGSETGDENGFVTIAGNNFRLEFREGRDWLGIEFQTLGLAKNESFEWSIDTDMYPISEERYTDFKNSIAEDILLFLRALNDKEVLVADKRVLIPEKDGYTLLKRGPLGFRTRKYKNLGYSSKRADFTPFEVK